MSPRGPRQKIETWHTGELKRCGDFQGLKVPFMQSHSVVMDYCQNLWIGVEGKEFSFTQS